MSTGFGINQRIVDRLLQEGRIELGDHRAVVARATRGKQRVEDVIVESRVMTEPDLLRFIATLHGTRFVSTEKLSKAAIDSWVLQKVPAQSAELHGVMPVMLDESHQVLTVATADPDNAPALQEIRLAARVREVRALVARPAAVRAAIAQFYRNDQRPFLEMLRPLDALPSDPFALGGGTGAQLRGFEAPPPLRVPTPPPVPRSSPPVLSPTPPPVRPVLRASTPPPPRVSTEEKAGPAILAAPALEAVHVLVNLVENGRADLRGHSATVARLARKLCERVGLPEAQRLAIVLAAHLHDLGKPATYHLTALNVADYAGHKTAAQKTYELPLHLLESAQLPEDARTAIAQMYERFDGQGLPSGVAAKDISIGARMLAILDTYADLTQNPRNPYRKILRPLEACDVLAQHRGTIFDPNLVDLFRHSMSGEDLRAKLLADRHHVLLVDPDPEDTTVLELRLVEQGFEVRTARTSQGARQDLETRDVSVVVSEMDLEAPGEGLALRERAAKEPWGRDVVWVMLTSRTDRALAQRAFDLGIDDVVSKPASADILAAKLRTLVERKAAQRGSSGVSGSLSEMALPDIVQVLFHGRKTCALRLASSQGAAEIHFQDGRVVHALFGDTRGEDAFYKTLKLSDGSFRLDPSFQPKDITIQASPEALLLEGMRRLDEGLVT